MDEDGGHLFFKCHLAKHVWRLLNLEAEREVLVGIADATSVVARVDFETKRTEERANDDHSLVYLDREKSGRRVVAEALKLLLAILNSMQMRTPTCMSRSWCLAGLG